MSYLGDCPCGVPRTKSGSKALDHTIPSDDEAAQLYAGSLGTNMLQVGPDQPIETNANGSKQSALPYRFDLLDSKAMFRLAAIRYYGTDIRGYTPDNWRGISAESHVNHALSHLMAWIGGDKQDDHLGHAFCRLMFAVGVEEAGK